MTEETTKPMYCHKDLSNLCKRDQCPMWFTPPNPDAEGDCAEALNQKQLFWDTLHTITEEMRQEAIDLAAKKTAEETS